MQNSNLNKVVALFVVGAVGLVLWSLLDWSRARSLLVALGGQNLEVSSGVGVVAVFFLLPVCALVGCIVAGLAHMSLGRLLRLSLTRRGWARFFCQAFAHDLMRWWETQYKTAARQSGRFKALSDGDPNFSPSVGSGHLFHLSKGEALNWAMRHYSTAILAYNFAFLLIVGLVVLVRQALLGRIDNWPMVLFVLLVSLYGLGSIAIERYLYSFQVAYRAGSFDIYENDYRGKNSTQNLSTEPEAPTYGDPLPSEHLPGNEDAQ